LLKKKLRLRFYFFLILSPIFSTVLHTFLLRRHPPWKSEMLIALLFPLLVSFVFSTTAQRTKAAASSTKPNEAARILKRTKTPSEDITSYWETNDFSADLSQHKELMKNLIKDPIGFSERFLDRIRKHGKRASFPEFKGVISFLIQELYQNEDSIRFCNSSTAMQSWRQIIQHSVYCRNLTLI
jgi:hypothetical protein